MQISGKKMCAGELFSVEFYSDIPYLLACGGSKGEVAIWDTEENKGVQCHFPLSAELLELKRSQDAI